MPYLFSSEDACYTGRASGQSAIDTSESYARDPSSLSLSCALQTKTVSVHDNSVFA